MVLLGVLALIAGSALAVVAGGYRGVDVWVWDWADVAFRRRTRYGTPWWSLAVMRIQFGIVGAVFLVAGAHTLVRRRQRPSPATVSAEHAKDPRSIGPGVLQRVGPTEFEPYSLVLVSGIGVRP